MAYVEVLTGHSLTAEQWDEQLFATYIGQLQWKNFMGTSTGSIIQIKDDLTKKPGDAITIGLRGELQGGKVTGNSKGIGNEGSVDFYGRRIVIDNVRHLVKVEDIPMSQKRVGWDVLQQAKEALADKAAEDLDDEITIQLSDTATGRVRGKYLYGAADSNWNATHTTALTNIDNTADQLTTNMISLCKRKATLTSGGNLAQAKIRPMKVMKGKNVEEWFCFHAHTLCIRDMVTNDAAWRNAQLNIPPQSNSDSPIFSGSWFKGAWDGVLIYDYERIQLVSSTVQVAHNLFLGAQAAAVVWGQRSKFGEEFSDLDHAVSYEQHEIRGVDKLAFDRSTVEDHGVVHCFSAAVAD